MDFAYSDEQADLAELCRTVFGKLTPDRLREMEEQGEPLHGTELWATLAASGLLGIAFDESVGGAGGTLVDLGIAFREAGRAATPTTFASTVAAALVVDRLGTAAQRSALLPLMIEGALLATPAVAEERTDGDAEHLETTATADEEHWVLDGTKSHVQNASLSQLLVVAAVVAGPPRRVGFFVVDRGLPGVVLTRQHTFAVDVQDRVDLQHVRVARDAELGAGERGWPEFVRCRDVLLALQNMEMLGGAELVLERTADYVRVRHQFGRPIGSFQAVQHAVADIAIAVAGGEAAALHALWALDHDPAAHRYVAMANAWLAATFVDATVAAHQVHGGMGYVRESNLYLWSQRAKSLEPRWGGRRQQLRAVAEDLYRQR